MRKFMIAFYKAVLPGHIKRVIFCVTVYGHIASETGYRVGARELSQLNKVLKLAKNVKGMVFPVAWSDAIWSAIPAPPLDDDKRRTFIDSVLKHTPNYLLYGTEKMEGDLNAVLTVFFKEQILADTIDVIRHKA